MAGMTVRKYTNRIVLISAVNGLISLLFYSLAFLGACAILDSLVTALCFILKAT